MSAMDSLENDNDRFKRRSEEAMRRRKVPVESDTVIALHDLSGGNEKGDVAGEQKEAPESKKDFFAVLPGEVPEAPDGGDFIIDPDADPSAPGVFTYAGNRLRRVNPAEYAEITAITANAKTRREKGPRRLAALLPTPGPADAPLTRPDDLPADRVDDYDVKAAPYTREELADAKKNLSKTLNRIVADGIDERRHIEFNRKIKDSNTPDAVRSLAAEFRGFQESRRRAPDPEPLPRSPRLADDVPEPLPPPRHGSRDSILPPPPREEQPLDPAKFKRVRDIGPGGRWASGFGTPRRFYFTHPNAPRHPDGTEKRFTEAQVEELKQRYSGGSPDGPAVGGLYRGEGGRGRFEIDPKEYVGIRPKSLREIAANERDQKFFGELLAGLIPGQSADLLARAVQEGSLSEQERKIVLFAQYEYTKRAADWEKMSANITGKDVERAMKRNPHLEAAIRLNDSEANNFEITTKVWKEELMHLAMRDKDAFTTVYESQMALAKLQETARFKNWNADVTELCKRAGVDPRDYDAVFNLKSAKERRGTRGWLKLNIQKDLTGFSRIAGALGITAVRANRMMKEADRIKRQTHDHWASPTSWVLRDVDKHLSTVTRLMALTIGEPEKLKALTKAAMRNEEMRLERDAGPKNRQETDNQYTSAARVELSPAELQRIFNRDKPAAWAGWNAAERENWRDNTWNPPEAHGGERRVGIWAQIFSAFKNWLFDSRKRELPVT